MKTLSNARVSAGRSQSDLERALGIGVGWIESYETGATFPSFSLLLALATELGVPLEDLFSELPETPPQDIVRSLNAVENGGGLDLLFKYSRYDAKYYLPDASIGEFDEILNVLRVMLAKKGGVSEEGDTVKRDAVVACFLKAVRLWPHANPSDIWWFLVYRAFCDYLNHPATNAGLDLAQSWKRTSGWALEKIVVDHYSGELARHGVKISIADRQKRSEIVSEIKVKDRLEADKIDVVLEGLTASGPKFFGVVHVKASFAERRTDDIHMSQLLKGAGYTTPIWTMDCKSAPAALPINRGELGVAEGSRSAKRRDIEDEGYFTRCFSYNSNTVPSKSTLPADRRIYTCNFTDPNDQFCSFIVARWRSFYST